MGYKWYNCKIHSICIYEVHTPIGSHGFCTVMIFFFHIVSYDCQDRNGLGDCSDLCLQTPTGRTCACFNGGHLKEDGRTCDNSQFNIIHIFSLLSGTGTVADPQGVRRVCSTSPPPPHFEIKISNRTPLSTLNPLSKLPGSTPAVVIPLQIWN